MLFIQNFLKKLATFTAKHLGSILFLTNLYASRLATLLKNDSNTDVFLWILQTLRTSILKNICEWLVLKVVIYCILQNYSRSRLAFQIDLLFLLKHKITLFYLFSFVFIRFITRYHSLSLIVIFCYSLSFLVIRCNLLYKSLSFFVPLVVIRCHSLTFDVTRCTTRLSFYKRSLFNVFLFTSLIIETKTKILSLKF